MIRTKKRLRYRNIQKSDEYFCCSHHGYLFHNYSEFQEFNDTDDDAPLDLSDL
jgi:hypothetical protein